MFINEFQIKFLLSAHIFIFIFTHSLVTLCGSPIFYGHKRVSVIRVFVLIRFSSASFFLNSSFPCTSRVLVAIGPNYFRVFFSVTLFRLKFAFQLIEGIPRKSAIMIIILSTKWSKSNIARKLILMIRKTWWGEIALWPYSNNHNVFLIYHKNINYFRVHVYKYICSGICWKWWFADAWILSLG